MQENNLMGIKHVIQYHFVRQNAMRDFWQDLVSKQYDYLLNITFLTIYVLYI